MESRILFTFAILAGVLFSTSFAELCEVQGEICTDNKACPATGGDADCVYSCTDGMKLYNFQVCNGLNECADGKDEEGCTKFKCWDSTQEVDYSKKCDKTKDCSNGSDESTIIGCTETDGTTPATTPTPDGSGTNQTNTTTTKPDGSGTDQTNTTTTKPAPPPTQPPTPANNETEIPMKEEHYELCGQINKKVDAANPTLVIDAEKYYKMGRHCYLEIDASMGANMMCDNLNIGFGCKMGVYTTMNGSGASENTTLQCLDTLTCNFCPVKKDNVKGMVTLKFGYGLFPLQAKCTFTYVASVSI